MISLYGLFLGSQLILAAADQIPNFDFMPSCRGGAVDAGSTLENCANDEKSARDQLAKEWAKFPAADKANCSGATEEFAPSYVELLECLEMYRDVRTMPKDETPATDR
jgi:hypothetical protein